MYQVSTYHHHKTIVNGDSDAVTELKETRNFKTKKEAKAWILGKTGERNYAKVRQCWEKGENPSYVYCFTDKTWFHEGRGETETEFFLYKLIKVKA